MCFNLAACRCTETKLVDDPHGLDKHALRVTRVYLNLSPYEPVTDLISGKKCSPMMQISTVYKAEQGHVMTLPSTFSSLILNMWRAAFMQTKCTLHSWPCCVVYTLYIRDGENFDV